MVKERLMKRKTGMIYHCGCLSVIIISIFLVLTGCSRSYNSNGQKIYFTSSDSSGDSISYSGETGTMMQGKFACVKCHGTEGQGGTYIFMIQSYDIPNITWPELTGQHMDHDPYDEETVKQAITKGLEPAGNPLEYPMPRWQMSSQDLDDLVNFIKTLK
jgi:cytochrome c oxidase subunit 2